MTSIHQLLTYWKGTAFPHITNHATEESLNHYVEDATQLANEMIKEGLKTNISIPQQIKDYKEQLDAIELFLNSLTQGHLKKKDLKKIHEEFKESLGTSTTADTLRHLQVIWELNILALLKMKAIQNDNMYGVQLLNATNLPAAFMGDLSPEGMAFIAKAVAEAEGMA